MIYVTGDTHGPKTLGHTGIDGVSRRFKTIAFPEQKEMTKDDYVIVCGDFGCVFDYDSRYDPTRSGFKDVIGLEHGESDEEKYWLDWLDEKPFTTLFCDGNHENFDRLEAAYEEVDFHGGKAHKIRNSVYHLERGYVFDIDGASIFVFGGAQSHDIDDGIVRPYEFDSEKAFKNRVRILRKRTNLFRIDHQTWWERELPSEAEMERGLRELEKHGNKVDFIITHCAPKQVASAVGQFDDNVLVLYFDKIADTVDFSRWFFAHYHRNCQIFTKYIMLYEQIVRIW